MAPSKLNPQDAFDLVTRRQGKELPVTKDPKDIEAGFGEKNARSEEPKPRWRRYLLLLVLTVLACIVVAGIFSFYWFISTQSEPGSAEKSPLAAAPAVIDEAKAKEMIEANLRAFLQAETNEERLKYVYMPEDEKPQLDVYYNERGHVHTPAWKIERMEHVKSVQGDVWFVVYRDLNKIQRLVSFQRFGDHFLLHWSAMTAFCEIPWEKFIVQRPSTPVTMRCYVRQYQGQWPLGIPSDQYHCFLIEDRGGLFSELAIMDRSSVGYTTLKGLPNASRHPVTLELGYHHFPTNGRGGEILEIQSLKHLRWQQMSMDARVQGLELETPDYE
ncbi:MAG: hypothetical protein H7A51_03460 [Akkermansiaceae bacterium]|nr:hypothetical protein [Akkermansiaceae bacterium]